MSTMSDGTAPPTRNTFVGDVWINLKRWLIKTTVTPMSLVFSLFQLVIFLVLFSGVFGQAIGGALTHSFGEHINYITYLVPAIVIQSAFFTAGSSGGGLTADRDIRYFAEFVDSGKDIHAVDDDPDDDKFLEAAVAGNVDYIVSGDGHLLDLDVFRGIPIVDPRTFYELLTD